MRNQFVCASVSTWKPWLLATSKQWQTNAYQLTSTQGKPVKWMTTKWIQFRKQDPNIHFDEEEFHYLRLKSATEAFHAYYRSHATRTRHGLMVCRIQICMTVTRMTVNNCEIPRDWILWILYCELLTSCTLMNKWPNMWILLFTKIKSEIAV